jgi:hypothetical protein
MITYRIEEKNDDGTYGGTSRISDEYGSATAATRDKRWSQYGARMVSVHWTDEMQPTVRLVVVLGLSEGISSSYSPPADDDTIRVAARQKLADTELRAANERARAAAMELNRTKLLRA